MAYFNTREDNLERSYRKVEAMYRKDMGFEEIVRATGLTMMDVLDICQKIFAIDMSKARRRELYN